MTTRPPRVIIAGAGIAGLTAALSLHAAGITDVTVHEAVAEPHPLGVGINILPHAVRELIELGLGERLAAIGVATADLTFLTHRGQRIWSEPRGLRAGYRWPQYSIHRGRLQMMLLEAVRERLGPESVVLGSPVTGLDHDADLLVGADGIRSSVRQALFPGEGEPVPGGDVLWRGTTYAKPFLTGGSMLMIGDSTQKLVIYPVAPPGDDGTQLINWAVQHRARVEGVPTGDWNQPVEVERVLPHVRGWHCDELDVQALIEGAEQVFQYPLVDRDPLPRWSAERVTLMGDAAHPMYPTGSNGGTQAVIDARVLAYALAHGLGLEFYEEQRRPVTNNIVLANRKDGPEVILRLACERAPGGFADVEQVLPLAEREEIALRYKQLAGFEPATLNARRSWTVHP
ncbi:flavin-dependent oxidoreductase [Nonomuraea fuscirosea]|jgi:5-methylphenazine-1-carboxylate 1-monooxygenase|uniref:2-polyprenyl-6-methoxyphenol hydroxylase-like FAD-dependent oxidoreductase n=1 Tax=Nonomuraea fuscirosea TaxID=1291556 RepID=A0A2T0M5X1_9ACTN|nr:flavin-dependent oxidoreductase [Nonomuraea fuscirosea]PRX52890.1 2-polyprenyl-6-methoxyphenol hydroxylase-like FAD-dependent oxidoreductase [Nonomuraea fuscirosea]WSA55694.1 flavin-dependent oxidoreductase [Nonomuraea fuscirosea]